jgi:hypothetical protein
MLYPTFATVLASFQQDASILTFSCINLQCGTGLDQDQKHVATNILRQQYDLITARDVRDVMALLLCGQDQKYYNHKNHLIDQWGPELPHLDLKKRTQSPYSLVNGRRSASTGSSRRSSNVLTPPSSSPRDADNLQVRPTTPLPRRRLFSTPSTSSSQSEHSRQGTPAVHDDNDTQDIEQSRTSTLDGHDSPSVERLRRRARRSSSMYEQEMEIDGAATDIRLSTESSHRPASQDLTDDERMEEADEQVPGAFVSENSDATQRSDRRQTFYQESINENPEQGRRSRQLPVPEDRPPFYLSETTNFAPWTIRREVLNLLWEPIPDTRSKGCVYVVKVKDRPYVKIGVTTRKLKIRLNEINTQISSVHGLSLESECLYSSRNDIPVLELMRLEKIIHTDLAYFQRNIQTLRLREFFEIDLESAQERVELWIDIMTGIKLKTGSEVASTYRSEAEDAVSKIARINDCPPSGTDRMSRQWWHTVNADTELRTQEWSKIFKREEGGYQVIWRKRFDTWVAGIVGLPLFVFFSSAMLTGSVWSGFVLSAVSLVAWLRYWESSRLRTKGLRMFLET